MRSSTLLLALVAVASLVCVPARAQWCLNENGEHVDWFVIIKIPRLSASSGAGVAAGTAYLYGDANSLNKTQFWSQSANQIEDDTSSVGRTLQQIYDLSNNTNTNGYTMYNDEDPDGGTSHSYGHTKGMLAFSAASSFWLIHSVPKFASSPDNEDTYKYPTNGKQFGQSMLCMSLDLPNVDKAFLQLQYTNPQVYGSQWPATLTDRLPNGDAFTNQGKVVMDASTSLANIKTVGGKSFQHFAKTVAWGRSIFGDFIGPQYNGPMLVETWQRPYEQPLLPPDSKSAVYSVMTMKAPAYANWDGVSWKVTQEHSKWGIIIKDSNPVVCIGDINKQESQWKRSGGMMCTTDAALHKAYAVMIATTDESSVRAAIATE